MPTPGSESGTGGVRDETPRVRRCRKLAEEGELGQFVVNGSLCFLRLKENDISIIRD